MLPKMSKRRRTFKRRATAKRPIDKAITTIDRVITNTTTSGDLLQIVNAGTVTGLRWTWTFRSVTQATAPQILWAIVYVRDGEIASSLDLSNLASMYDPEQNVLAFGSMLLEPNSSTSAPTVVHVEGTSKAMRKMIDRDRLQLVSVSDALNATQMFGVVQYFVMY